MYVVESGQVDVLRELADGGEELLAQVTEGAYLGELGPLFGLRRSATARAGAEGAELTGLTVAAFRERTGAGIAGVIAGTR